MYEDKIRLFCYALAYCKNRFLPSFSTVVCSVQTLKKKVFQLITVTAVRVVTVR